MSCSPFDLRDYFFGELSREEQTAVDRHVSSCAACREELEGLRLTQSTLLTLRDEEPPRRIAFVSDPVFEPKWWQKLWQSGPQLGFASAAMLSAALLVHAFVPRTTVLAPERTPQAQVQTTAAAKSFSEAEVRAIVAGAVKESEARQSAKLEQVLAKTERDWELQHKATLVQLSDYMEVLQKRVNLVLRASNDTPAGGER